MSWTDPKTWAVGEVVTANLLNEQVRDNLTALKTTNSAQYLLDESTDYTTTSTSFADVDATKFSHTITTTGGDVLIGFNASIKMSGGSLPVYFDVDMDGTRVASDDGIVIISSTTSNNINGGSFIYLVTNVAGGAHTFKLQWKVDAGTATLYAGAGSNDGFSRPADMHPQFWVLEV